MAPFRNYPKKHLPTCTRTTPLIANHQCRRPRHVKRLSLRGSAAQSYQHNSGVQHSFPRARASVLQLRRWSLLEARVRDAVPRPLQVSRHDGCACCVVRVRLLRACGRAAPNVCQADTRAERKYEQLATRFADESMKSIRFRHQRICCGQLLAVVLCFSGVSNHIFINCNCAVICRHLIVAAALVASAIVVTLKFVEVKGEQDMLA